MNLHTKEAVNRLSCELAYMGTLFCLPLPVCPGKRKARDHASQGLWLLILSVLSCSKVPFSHTSHSSPAKSSIPCPVGYALVFTLFLFAMLFLLGKAVQSAMRIHNRSEPESILFFESRPIIR